MESLHGSSMMELIIVFVLSRSNESNDRWGKYLRYLIWVRLTLVFGTQVFKTLFVVLLQFKHAFYYHWLINNNFSFDNVWFFTTRYGFIKSRFQILEWSFRKSFQKLIFESNDFLTGGGKENRIWGKIFCPTGPLSFLILNNECPLLILYVHFWWLHIGFLFS